jgi:hypothetical protein
MVDIRREQEGEHKDDDDAVDESIDYGEKRQPDHRP